MKRVSLFIATATLASFLLIGCGKKEEKPAAPDTGDTTSEVKDAVKDATDAAKDKAGEVKEDAEKAAGEVKEEADKAADKAKDAVKDLTK